MKVVTICGSMKLKEQMQKIAGTLAKEKGWCILQPVFCIETTNLTEQDFKLLSEEHFKRIELSDAIYVVNIDGYIGSATKKEIEFAMKHNKEIFYHECQN